MYAKIKPSVKWKFLDKAIYSHHFFFISKDLVQNIFPDSQCSSLRILWRVHGILTGIFSVYSSCSAILRINIKPAFMFITWWSHVVSLLLFQAWLSEGGNWMRSGKGQYLCQQVSYKFLACISGKKKKIVIYMPIRVNF